VGHTGAVVGVIMVDVFLPENLKQTYTIHLQVHLLHKAPSLIVEGLGHLHLELDE